MSELSIHVKLQLQAVQIERLQQDKVVLTDMLATVRAENLMLKNALESLNAQAESARSTNEPSLPAPDPHEAEGPVVEDGPDDGGACTPRLGNVPPLCDED
jgi:hypothetical protein